MEISIEKAREIVKIRDILKTPQTFSYRCKIKVITKHVSPSMIRFLLDGIPNTKWAEYMDDTPVNCIFDLRSSGFL